MGWQRDDHEGYVAGFAGGRRLSHLNDKKTRHDVTHVEAACTCGWESLIEPAPPGTKWYPFCVVLGDGDDGDDGPTEERLRRLWDVHADEVRAELQCRAENKLAYQLSHAIYDALRRQHDRVAVVDSERECMTAARAVLAELRRLERLKETP